ncbi:inosine/xanthosine triphosphatase [Virgibacillus indicus]|uniref:inosine/xanthosine triphosphatase n=1 Tax=Virgibacillus indicus TaxID=2024554 RepID=A0A265NEF6_9BACI|nr:DUF84 family protein [Virgibacillus indicus]OZU89676.1 inosine/xanthosine triphosphatase [Virgibacillus indicus]
MEIIIGSENPTKIKAVQEIFPKHVVKSMDVPSNVAAQPFSDEETRQGAINRAVHCTESSSKGLGVGLEGGVMYAGDQLFLCNWGALVTQDKKIYTASGARIALPEEIDLELKNGKELGDVMDVYAQKQEVRKKEGAIGIFTNELVSRQEMFEHVVKLLRGQWEYWTNSR